MIAHKQGSNVSGHDDSLTVEELEKQLDESVKNCGLELLNRLSTPSPYLTASYMIDDVNGFEGPSRCMDIESRRESEPEGHDRHEQ